MVEMGGCEKGKKDISNAIVCVIATESDAKSELGIDPEFGNFVAPVDSNPAHLYRFIQAR